MFEVISCKMGESHITFVVQIDLNKKVHQLDFDQVETEEMKNDKRITPDLPETRPRRRSIHSIRSSLGIFPLRNTNI